MSSVFSHESAQRNDAGHLIDIFKDIFIYIYIYIQEQNLSYLIAPQHGIYSEKYNDMAYKSKHQNPSEGFSTRNIYGKYNSMALAAGCPYNTVMFPLRWRHNEHDGVSNHQPHDCLLNRLFGRRSK